MAKANNMVYTKYVKVQSGPHGAAACIDYINDDNKTMEDSVLSGDEALIDYMIDETKTVNPDDFKRLVTGHNCRVSTAAQEFSIAERRYHAKHNENLRGGYKANRAFHVILSYKGNELDPQFVHAMGLEFARRVCGDRYQAVVATHLNTDNYHNHICINAYPIYGGRKFRDALHAYRGFREIADELSLEYGLPINIGDEKAKTRYKPWAEYVKSAEGKSWKKNITDDLDKAIAAAETYEGVLSVMDKMGYGIQHNAKSVTFSKGGGRVRDNRLGRKYTAEGIEEYYETQKKKNERQEAIEEIQERRRQQTQKTRGRSRVYVSYTDQYGRRLNFITRYILLVRGFVNQIMDQYYDQQLNEKFTNNVRFWPARLKLELLDQVMALAEKCDGLDLQDLFKTQKQLRSAIAAGEIYRNGMADILADIDKFKDLAPAVSALGIDYADVAVRPDEAEVRTNLAELEPMTGKTKSVLYQTIHNSGYRLTCKFEELTETEAKDIISAVRNDRRTDLPPGLHYRYNRDEKASENQDGKTAPRQKIDLAKYSSDDKKMLLEFKSAADHIAKYGIRTTEDADKMLSFYDDRTIKYEDSKKSLEGVKKQISDMYKLQKRLEQIGSAAFVYGPLYSGTAQEFNISLQTLRIGERIDNLTALDNALRQMVYAPASQLKSMTVPVPEDYILAKKLQEIVPAAFIGVDMSNAVSVRMALEDIKNKGLIADLIAKETQKEQERLRESERKSNDRRRDDKLTRSR